MCLQCITESVEFSKFGNWVIHKSTVDHPKWPKGAYGFIKKDDPTFILDVVPIYDPYMNATDEIFDTLSVAEWEEQSEITAIGKEIERQLLPQIVNAGFIVCNDFINNVTLEGYVEKYGEIFYWLQQFLAIKEKK